MADLSTCLGLQAFSAADKAEIRDYIKKAGSDIAGVEAYLSDLQAERRELAIEVRKALGMDAPANAPADPFDVPQTGKTPDQVRAEAEAAVRANQSKLRKPGGNDGDAGPLFGGDQDLFDPPKAKPAQRQPATGDELIQQGRAILQRYSGDSDGLFNQNSGTDLRASLEGIKLADDLLAAKTMAAKIKVADNFVLKSGKRTGMEHLVVLDADGVPLAMMLGGPDWVGLHAEVYRAADAGIVAYATHNHPRSTSHSGPDIAMLFAGFSPLTVMGHDGTRHTVTVAAGASMNWEGKTKAGIAQTKSLGEVFGQIRFSVESLTNGMVNAMQDVPRDGKPAYWARMNGPLFPAILDRMGIVSYDDVQAVEKAEALGINFEDIYGQVSGNGRDALRRAGFNIPQERNPSRNRPAGSGGKTASPRPDGADRQPQDDAGNGDRGGRVSTQPVSTGNADLDGALDDLFGDDTDVPGPGDDLAGSGGDGVAADRVGDGDVPASTGRSGRGTGGRGRKAAGGNGKRRSGSGVPDGDAPAMGGQRDPGTDGPAGADSQSAASGNGGRGDGGGNGRLPSDTGRKGDPAGNASGSPAKLTPAQQLAAIRGILKEDAIDFVAGPPRRNTDTDAFRKWFGDSKVVGPDGEPLVVYHGTDQNQIFTAFDPRMIGGRDAGFYGRGFYFTPDMALAEEYQVDGDGDVQGRIISAYVAIQRPFEWNTYTDAGVARLKSAFAAAGFPNETVERFTNLTSRTERAFNAWLRREGFDGVIRYTTVEPDEGVFIQMIDEIVAFDPTQIKSIFNAGTWDAASPYMLREDASTGLDPHKAEALQSIFIGALEGVDVAQATDRSLFASIVLPLKDAGMTRAEVAELSPYLQAFLLDLRAGRINMNPEAAPSALDRLNAVVPGWSGMNNMLTNAHPERGGIIDQQLVNKKWFVILNGSEKSASDLDTLDQAVDWFIQNYTAANPKTPNRDALQAKADKVRVILGDRANIDATLPLLLPEQRDDVAKVEARFAKPDGHGMMITNGTGTGKAQPLDAAILTPLGWRKMGDLAVGDEVIAVDGTATQVVGVYPQGEKPIYRVEFSDGAATECCDEHLWETQTLYARRKGRANPAWGCAQPQVRSLAEIRASLNAQHFVPVASAIQHPALALPVQPYTLGVILGDGCMRGAGLTFSGQDQETADAVALELAGDFQVARISEPRCPTWRIGDEQQKDHRGKFIPHRLIQALRDVGLWGADSAAKFIPDDYLVSSTQDRILLLQGLMDTDGTVDRRTGSVSFCTVSPGLANGVTALVRSLGGVATRTMTRKFYTHKGERREGQLAYIITMHLPNDIAPFRVSRKAALVRPKHHAPRRKIVSVSLVGEKPAQCIAVAHPRHLYVTDDYVLTHNTFSGGGVVKRFVQQGKTNILVVAPSDAVIDGWKRTFVALGIPASTLADKKDAGQGVVITTYANMGDNNALASREWDLVVTDEAQNLMANAQGDVTKPLRVLRAITNRPEDFAQLVRMRHADEIERLWPKSEAKVMRRASDAVEAARRALDDKMRKEVEALQKNPPTRSKALFLSATPFAYDKAVDYAEGYLFRYPEDGRINGSNQSGRNLFMVQNFGYRIRYHKLTKPEHAVDSAVFERDFHEKLKREGVLSGRSLQVDVDYDRRFVRKEDADGSRLDEALELLDQLARAESDKQSAVIKAGQIGTRLDQPFNALQSHMRKNFDYLARQQLLEAIKARMAAEEIRKHLALGRKVVVFHDFNVGGGLNPFTHLKTQVTGIDEATGEEIRTPVSPMTAEAADGYRKLLEAHPWIRDLNFAGYKPPIKHLPESLGKTVRLFNGKVNDKQRLQNLADFNRDGSGVDVLVVQADAGGAGISMHDTTGGHQRVLINLGMPTKPTTTLQQEGRILRVGSASDAPFRYFTIGTGWERTAFAQRIAERSGTVENLALGNDARDMMNAFIDAYMDATDFEPSADDGKGGKAKDRRSHNITPFQRAVSHYFGRPKISGRRDQRDGIDFYPTAEPLAYKMVEWAGIRQNERVLEPSAGDGAIVRYMPDDVALTFVEPSADLRSTAQLRAPKGDAKETTFEQHHISNKYHVIVMNPPFGSGGATAMQHLAKAAKHLRVGGRIVALIPTGPSADKKFEAWWHSDDAKEFSLRAVVNLPSVAFERAGTAVMSRVVVLDRLDKEDAAQVLGISSTIDLTNIDSTSALFDRIESMELRPRPAPKRDVVEELEAEGQDATSPAVKPAGAPLATEVGSFAKTTVKSQKGKDFPAAYHAAKVEREVYDQMKDAAQAHMGWWHKNAGTPKGAGPTFAFRTEAQRDAFMADMQKPTVGGLEETAYHGTPHDFDRFSLEAIGTGEGAQVYGWGLYFAGRRAVSEWYRKTLAKRKILLDKEEVPETMRTSYLSAAASADWDAFAAKHQFGLSQDEIAFEVSPSEWRDAKALYPISLKSMFLHIRGDVEGGGWALADRLERAEQDELAKVARVSHLPHYLSEAVARLAAIKTFKAAASESGTGRLFTVDIPGPESLLDWDAKLSDQPEAVTSAMRDLMPDFFGSDKESNWTEQAETDVTRRAFVDQFGWQIVDMDGYFAVLSPAGKITGGKTISENKKLADAKKSAASARKHYSGDTTGADAYRMLSARIGGDRRASEALRAAGIPGHRYLDGGSRGAGEGTHNYVIYDDQAIQIIAKEQRAQMVREAAATTEEITRLMPALRAELDRLDLKRVRLSRVEEGMTWQGAFVVTGDGEMEIVIGASLDPVKTLHHEVIHALRAMDLFTPDEWTALTLAAERMWLEKHDIAARYPHLTAEERIEEAIAEEFSEAMAAKRAPRGSILIRAFNKMARIFRAFRNVLNGAGYQTPEDIFGRVLAGEIGRRQAGNTGARAGMAMQATPEMFADYQAAKAEASRLRDELKNPEKTEAQIEAAFDKMIAVGPERDKLAKVLAAEDGGLELKAKDGRNAAISKSQDGKGGWRTTYFDKNGFSGHTEYATKVEAIKEALLEGYEQLDTGALRLAIRSGTFFARFQRKGSDNQPDMFAAPEPTKTAGMTADQRRELDARQQQSKMRKTGGNSGDAGPLFNDDRDLFGQRTMFQRQPLAVRPLTAQGRAHRNSAMGATPFIPDRRIWETLTQAGVPIWQRLRDLPGAASDAVDKARGVIQDRFLPVLRAQEAVMRQTGRLLPKEHDAYVAETTFSGKVGRHLLEVDEEYTKPIIKIIADSKGRIDADSVGEWLYARHAVERNAYIATINPMMPDGGSGMMDADAQMILQAAAASPDAAAYDQIGTLIDKLRERNLALREDAGLISRADANLWRTQYKHYVPLKGFEETDHAEALMDLGGVRTGRRFSIRGQETRRALGRGSEAFNPLQSAITQAQEVAIRAEKNRVAKALYDLAAAYPSKALWEVKQPKQKRYFNRTTGLVESRVEDPVTMVLEPNEMAVKIDGQEHRILFNDQRLAEAAGTLGADQMSGVVRVLSILSRFFSMTRTMLNPEFMVTNAFRDFQTAQFNIQAFGENDKARIAKAMAKNWRKAFMGAMRGSTYKFDTEWSKYYREFQKAGAQVWFWTMEQPEAARGDLENRIKLARGNKAQRALKVMTTPAAFFSFRDNAALEYIQRVNMAVDNAIRLAAFVEARRAGWDVEKAAFLAKELTVNFNRRGEAGATMNALYPFFNAAIQGSVRTLKALSSRRVGLMVLTAFAAGALNDMLNAALSDEDEDGELLYDKVQNFRNERNFHMVLWGTGDNPWSVPMPYGYNVFPYAGQQLGKVIRGVKKPDDAFADVVGAIFGAFSPVSAKTPAQFVSPFLSDPVVEMAENKNWLGIPIYPEDYGNQSEPDAYVHFKGATAVSKWVAQSLNSITGGDFRESGAVDVSPETLDHLANFVVGSAGAFFGRSADVVGKVLSGDTESIEQRNVPFVRILTSPVGDWQDRDRFYRFSAEVKNAQADKKAYEAAQIPVPKKTADLAALYEDYLAANRELTGKGEWNPAKAGSIAARAQNKVWLSFNGKYIRVMGRQGE